MPSSSKKKPDVKAEISFPHVGLENVGVMKPFWALLCFTSAVLIFVAFADYRPQQTSLMTTAAVEEIRPNLVGTLGAGLSFWMFRLFGAVAWLVPAYLLWLFCAFMFRKSHFVTQLRFLFMGLSLLLGCGLLTLMDERILAPGKQAVASIYYSSGLGGVIGKLLFLKVLENSFGVFGSSLLLIVLGCTAFLLSIARQRNPNKVLESLIYKTGDRLNEVKDLSKKHLKDSVNNGAGFFKRLLSWRSKMQASTEKVEDDFLGAVSNSEKEASLKESPLTRKEKLLSRKVSAESANELEEILEKPFEALEEKKKNANVPLKIVAEEKVEKIQTAVPVQKGNYKFPSLDLLKEGGGETQISEAECQETVQNLVAKLSEFGVEVKMEEVHMGPVITRYEVTPARGVRVEKIVNLDKNIALGLKAPSVRILAPVPGKGCVGIELPNKNPLPVCLRDVIESKSWAESTAEIPIVLGKEVTGKPLIADLAKMPHLLIAGSTGSGKTVCINAIIASLLYHASPQDLRFIMVDPKIVEMKIYNDLPHMLIPVVTEPKKVPGALKWLIAEMERRYQIFAQVGARNIAGFNAKLAKDQEEKKHSDEMERSLSPEERLAVREAHAIASQDAIEIPEQKLPYIVCVIDELADLMMVAPADIETCVARLAQLARAAGIHLIIATQRPSVNVITGVIKANLPSRIAFKVASKVDSRTILDGNGADQLIGRGDMLFIPPGTASMVRAQGAFVSDEEINKLIEFLKQNGPPQFAAEVQEHLDNIEDEALLDDDAGNDDAMLPQAIEVLRSTQRASTSMLQRRLRIGYNRAARLMDILEQKGIVGPENGVQPREILKDLSIFSF